MSKAKIQIMDHLTQALRALKRLESERTLLKGHFSLIAKRYHVTVKELKKAYKESKKI